MNSTELACLCRVRCLALVAMTRAGGRPSNAQLLRAVEPVLGDLLHELLAVGRRAAKTPTSRRGFCSTVDTSQTEAPW